MIAGLGPNDRSSNLPISGVITVLVLVTGQPASQLVSEVSSAYQRCREEERVAEEVVVVVVVVLILMLSFLLPVFACFLPARTNLSFFDFAVGAAGEIDPH